MTLVKGEESGVLVEEVRGEGDEGTGVGEVIGHLVEPVRGWGEATMGGGG